MTVLGLLAAALGGGTASARADRAPVAHAAAICADHANQASAQRAKDTRDADGDGVYCETLPCPCLAPDPRAGGDGRGSGGADKPRKRMQKIDAKITAVVDGDTVKVRAYGAKRKRYTVRLIGIDTPETNRPGVPVECGGRQAGSNMYRLAYRTASDEDGDGLLDHGAKGRRVVLRTDPTQDTFDRYGRLLAYVTASGKGSLQKRQLRAGWAEVYVYGGKPFRQVRAFRTAQRSARHADRGVWGECDGDFHRPADDAHASTAARRYRGYVDRLDDQPTHEGSQGAGWRAVFKERAAGRVSYRVCLRHLADGIRRCWDRRTNANGASRVFVARFVNDRGGPGKWRARWLVDGHQVASWRFKVRPEFG